MRELKLWRFVEQCLGRGEPCGLMVVVDSKGSSPGRTGFKMALSADGSMAGSIGGGIMEHKLVELVRERLRDGKPCWEVRRQVHSKDAARDQSGMICSGEQTVALLRLDEQHLPQARILAETLSNALPWRLVLTGHGIAAVSAEAGAAAEQAFEQAGDGWEYVETRPRPRVAHVIGAGHVGLEMCRTLAALDFYVINYDDRHELNTMEANEHAHQRHVLPYPELASRIEGGPHEYAIIMTFGYRGDDEAARALLGKPFAYMGMMGSEAKVAKLLGDLRRDGWTDEEIGRMRCPAGLIPHCKTPAEIALSIAAEILSLDGKG